MSDNRSLYGCVDGDAEYEALRGALTDAILTVLERPGQTGRKAHTIHPHVRAKHIGELRRGESQWGMKRLNRVAKSLGIVCEIQVRLPAA